MIRFYWTEGAVADLDHIRRYLAQIDPRATRRLADRIADTVVTLSAAQAATRPLAGAGRGEIAITYPYLLRYRAEAGTIIVDAVRHASEARIV
ncbi:MAG: type II toxin-antitoxin system RelE/ParE family toxin [Sphingomonas bacterium]|nr:type II toxin-antitoxin system RelE/ParE family toxin [Sphingomonas bacterium]